MSEKKTEAAGVSVGEWGSQVLGEKCGDATM
jgi:hypothetical protein